MSKSGFGSFVDGIGKKEKRNKKQEKIDAGAKVDAGGGDTVLFQPKQSGDADLLKLLSGNTEKKKEKFEKDDNDRQRN